MKKEGDYVLSKKIHACSNSFKSMSTNISILNNISNNEDHV